MYKLQKALFGLKQAPRAWFSRIETHFLREGFQRCHSEQILFIKTSSGELHLQAAKKALRHLKGTINYEILYKKDGIEELLIFTDSDYAGDVKDMRSTSGSVFLMNSGAVS